MLIDSPRLTDADRVAWRLHESFDRQHGASRELARKEAQALRTIERWLGAEDAYVSVSWGKDSVVVAHLALMVDPDVPLCWVTIGALDNPDCASVRDVFLSAHPAQYVEVQADPPAVVDGWLATGARASGFGRANKELGARRLTGIRADESGTRRISAAVHGLSTASVCRPILHWSAADVFGYLAKHDLPVHPAYAMSRGGAMDREWLRTASIGGKRGADRGRREWESTYYPDVLDLLHRRKAD